MDNKSIAHTRWNCTYHIVFIPKYRRKIMYGETKRDLVEIVKKLCEMKEVELHRRAGVQRSCPHVCGDSAQDECLGVYVIS